MADEILKNIPLPADLPENWTSGQIVAPTGAEAGLDEQHGYNYLMKQVNNAQKALKALAAQREEDLARIKFWVSNDPTSPASFIGGTWEQIKDRFILAAGDTYPAGSTGGSATHTQTEDELVRHKHGFVQLRNGSIEPFIGIGRDGEIKDKDNYLAFGDTVKPFDNYRIDPKEVGGGQPMDILNPYYSAYIWRRVA